MWGPKDEDWQRAIAINLSAMFHFCPAVLPQMRARAYGRIVNVASIAGKEGNPRVVPDSATKAGVILEQLTQEQIRYMTERISMKRTGRPDEVAGVAHFLASPH